MNSVKLFIGCVITVAIAPGSWLTAQVQTIVPDVVPGAKPATMEQIKIHGAALESPRRGGDENAGSIVVHQQGRTRQHHLRLRRSRQDHGRKHIRLERIVGIRE